MSKYKVAGKSIVRHNLPGKATGTARFAVDVTTLQPLVGLVLRVPCPHAASFPSTQKKPKGSLLGRRSAGSAAAPAGCQIAVIAHSLNLAVATRNVWDFEDAGVEVIDP